MTATDWLGGIAFAAVIVAACVAGDHAERWHRVHRHRLHTIDIGPITDLHKCRACNFTCITMGDDQAARHNSQQAHRADIRRQLTEAGA